MIDLTLNVGSAVGAVDIVNVIDLFYQRSAVTVRMPLLPVMAGMRMILFRLMRMLVIVAAATDGMLVVMLMVVAAVTVGMVMRVFVLMAAVTVGMLVVMLMVMAAVTVGMSMFLFYFTVGIFWMAVCVGRSRRAAFPLRGDSHARFDGFCKRLDFGKQCVRVFSGNTELFGGKG